MATTAASGAATASSTSGDGGDITNNNNNNNNNNNTPNPSEKTTPRHQRQRQPSLLDSILDDDTSATANDEKQFGILCNDPLGLCLKATGSLAGRQSMETSGVFTSLVKLAQQLTPAQPAAASAAETTATTNPLITLECEESNLLVKEYDGHAIALKVPALLQPTNTETSKNSGEATTTNNDNNSHTNNNDAAGGK